MPSAGTPDRKPVPGTGYMHTIGPHMVREYPIIFDPARVGCLCTPGHVSPATITTNSSGRDEQSPPGNCARHISYSGDTTADNVSSPKPRTCGVYSKDTPKRAGDNGGSTCLSSLLIGYAPRRPSGPRPGPLGRGGLGPGLARLRCRDILGAAAGLQKATAEQAAGSLPGRCAAASARRRVTLMA